MQRRRAAPRSNGQSYTRRWIVSAPGSRPHRPCSSRTAVGLVACSPCQSDQLAVPKPRGGLQRVLWAVGPLQRRRHDRTTAGLVSSPAALKHHMRGPFHQSNRSECQWPKRTTAGSVASSAPRRARVFPSAANAAVAAKSRAAELHAAGTRLLPLGCNQDGDHVIAVFTHWGKFVDEEAGAPPLEVLRMALLAFEEACDVADKLGPEHRSIVVICLGWPVPVGVALAGYRIFTSHYPGRVKRIATYPVSDVWFPLISAALWFMAQADLVVLCASEAEVVEVARLKSPEMLPEAWRGGLDAVNERFQPDYAYMNSLSLEFVNPFASNGSEYDVALEGPWYEAVPQ
eukprot:NODE_8424_length_1496_cov_9.709277.p1 GENE.NODE_8424_length_1496_cov_9.709277~~NODE_8424_length_1496_cov_9.709277.p1  ORF type:complete len:344 (-),score=41.09 NODE_8424_length_1496_cov_9.709277:322-1353(-)